MGAEPLGGGGGPEVELAGLQEQVPGIGLAIVAQVHVERVRALDGRWQFTIDSQDGDRDSPFETWDRGRSPVLPSRAGRACSPDTRVIAQGRSAGRAVLDIVHLPINGSRRLELLTVNQQSPAPAALNTGTRRPTPIRSDDGYN